MSATPLCKKCGRATAPGYSVCGACYSAILHDKPRPERSGPAAADVTRFRPRAEGASEVGGSSGEKTEWSLLGAVLILGVDGVKRARPKVAPEDFGSEAHRLVYEACLTLADRREGVDLTTVQHQLEETGRLERAGGSAYLSMLVDGVPDVENVESYARLVHQARRTREAFPVLQGVVASVSEGRMSAAAAVEVVRRDLPLDPDWREPDELPPDAVEVPFLGDEFLPESLRPWLADAAERVSIPLEFVAAPALVALGSIVGRGCALRPMAHDDWQEVPNLWGGIVGPPGVMKSAALAEALRPVSRLAQEAARAFEEAGRGRGAALEVTKARRDATRDAMRQAAKTNDLTTLEAKRREMEDLAAEEERGDVTERRFMTSDATIEKLGVLLNANPRGILVTRDELTGWLRGLDREDRAESRAFFLESWNGTGRFTVDRIGRGTVHVEGLCSSILGGIQPGRIRPYVAGSIAGEEGDDGLIQRFGLLAWPDTFGEWRAVDRWPDKPARERAFSVFEKLSSFEPRSVGAMVEDGDGIPFFRFDPKAQGLFLEWRFELERRLRSDELSATPAFTSHLSKYRKLVPALSLLFHLTETVNGGGGAGVDERSLRLALSWADFLEEHARKLYAAELRPGISAARALAERIRKGDLPHGSPVRDLVRREWSGLNTSARVYQALDELQKRGWLRVATLLDLPIPRAAAGPPTRSSCTRSFGGVREKSAAPLSLSLVRARGRREETG